MRKTATAATDDVALIEGRSNINLQMTLLGAKEHNMVRDTTLFSKTETKKRWLLLQEDCYF